jgi:hypothetical protein
MLDLLDELGYELGPNHNGNFLLILIQSDGQTVSLQAVFYTLVAGEVQKPPGPRRPFRLPGHKLDMVGGQVVSLEVENLSLCRVPMTKVLGLMGAEVAAGLELTAGLFGGPGTFEALVLLPEPEFNGLVESDWKKLPQHIKQIKKEMARALRPVIGRRSTRRSL